MPVLRAERIGAALVPAAAILAYLNAFPGAFLFDDRAVIVDDPRLASVSAFAAGLPRMIRPLLKITFFVDRRLYGLDPAGYHALNVLLHCGSALLVLAVVSAVMARGDAWRPLERRWLPPGAALLFAVHPLGTETVTYISGRATGLASFFVLLSVGLALWAAAPGIGRAAFLARAGAAVSSFVLALLAKETAIVVPALLLLVQWAFPPRERDSSRRATLVQAACWGVATLFVAGATWHPRYGELLRASLGTRSVWQNLLTEASAVCYAFTLFVAPGRLNFDHDFRVAGSLFAWPTAAAVGALAALAVLARLAWRRMPLVSVGIGWFFVCLLPAHSVLPRYDVLSERNLYLPSVGIFIVCGALVTSLASRLGRRACAALALVSAAVVVLLAGATVDRNRAYRDAVTFWRDTAGKSPQKSRPHTNLGYALRQAGDLDGAIREYRVALSLDPESVVARENLLEAWREKERSR
jgi:protein O-mannosyl-transferase